MNRLNIISTLTTLSIVILFSSTNTFAQPQPQDPSPYSPRPLKPSEVIVSLAYSDSPLTLPFHELSRETVLENNFPKYKHQLSNQYTEVVRYFEEAMLNGQDLPILNTLVANFSKNPNVRVVGKQVSDKSSKFSVAVLGKSYRITFKITPEKHGSSIEVEGLKSSTVHSGSMPVRAPFQPAQANPIPFRWN